MADVSRVIDPFTDSEQPDDDIRNRLAVALRYIPDEEDAPRILAKGKGFLADRIIKIAEENGIYIHRDPRLVKILSDLEVDDLIPLPLYQVIAEILAMVFRLDTAKHH